MSLKALVCTALVSSGCTYFAIQYFLHDRYAPITDVTATHTQPAAEKSRPFSATPPAAPSENNNATLAPRPTVEHNNSDLASEPQNEAQNHYHSALQTLRRAEQFQRYSQRSGDLLTSMAERFEAENLDETWSTHYEVTFTELIYSDAVLSELAPHSIECKSQQCKLTFELSEANPATAQLNTLAEKVSSDDFDLISTADFSRGLLHVYLVKTDAEFFSTTSY